MNEAKCRTMVMERSQTLCEICAHEGHQMHHRRNRSQGGAWLPENILRVCVKCHGWVTVNPEKSRDNGWSVSGYKDPATTPVLYRSRWALLGGDGSVIHIPTPAEGRAA